MFLERLKRPLHGDAICDHNASCETMETNVASVVHNCLFYGLSSMANVVWTRWKNKAFGDGEKQVYEQHDDGAYND